jgi:eukaryotic-like serine/threonine-protein kinase
MKAVDRTGQRISKRFLVKKALGYGGMGAVYLVHDERKHRDVALKILHEEHRDRDWIVARFAREVEVLRALQHPNVVDLIDAGYEGRMLYYTMEYIKGHNLREWMYLQKKIDFGSAVHILCLVAKGLHYVHKRYIHRDIAPENVMVCSDGTVKIIDFGLARKNICNEGLTIIGTNLGRTEYNSPEQERNAAHADYRADIYPLGKMLYELMTGALPLRDASLGVLAEELPDGCIEFLERTLDDDPEGRYASAGEAGTSLLEIYNRGADVPDPALAGHAQHDAPVGLWARLKAWFRNRAGSNTH